MLENQEALMQRQPPRLAPVTPAGERQPGVGTAARLPAVLSGLQLPNGPAVAKVATLMGPPPRTREPAGRAVTVPDTGERLEDTEVGADANDVSRALMQQSAAITSLVARLTQGDAMADLIWLQASSGPSLSTKGAARREKMQQDLATGQSQYFLQVTQQARIHLGPSQKTVEDFLVSGVSLTGYLERYGGYKLRQEAAMIMWMLAHCMDAAADDNFALVREYLALTITALEQATYDNGWNIAVILSLLEELPAQVFAEKNVNLSGLGRPFSPLVPASWAAVALAYVKEADVLSNKKAETKSKAAPSTTISSPPSKVPKEAESKCRPSFEGGLKHLSKLDQGAGPHARFKMSAQWLDEGGLHAAGSHEAQSSSTGPVSHNCSKVSKQAPLA